LAAEEQIEAIALLKEEGLLGKSIMSFGVEIIAGLTDPSII